MYFVGGMMKEDLQNEQQYDTNLFDTIIILKQIYFIHSMVYQKFGISFLSNIQYGELMFVLRHGV